MPCPHNEITIVQRSQRQSAVAAAAYQSGEKLFCEYDQQVKHYPEKRGIVHNEILLPANAPPEYADRNTLWNAAEAVEKQWNSQLARRWVLTITNEKKIDNAIGIVANENKYHPIRDYLSDLVWDGTERIRFCLRHFLGADADDYTYEALKLFLLGAISRAFQPGCKFEIMLCLVGGQGAGKSTFFRLLAGNPG